MLAARENGPRAARTVPIAAQPCTVTTYPSWSANANVRPNGPSNGAVTMATPCPARSSCRRSMSSAFSHSATPSPACGRVQVHHGLADRERDRLGGEHHRSGRRAGRAPQPQPLRVKTRGCL